MFIVFWVKVIIFNLWDLYICVVYVCGLSIYIYFLKKLNLYIIWEIKFLSRIDC